MTRSDEASIAHLGEAGILARILPVAGLVEMSGQLTGFTVDVGPGDDAAVASLPPGARLVATTDTMIEGHDFLRTATTPECIGHKAAVQNLADIAAMGARPVALLASVSAPSNTSVQVLEGLTRGMVRRAARDGAELIGGDLGGAEQLTITVTALGALPAEQAPVLRSGAQPGDVVAVGSEQIGRSAAGLAVVLGGFARVVSDGEDDDAGATLQVDGLRAQSALDVLRWHNAPDPELSLGWHGGQSAHAMMDLSDGLLRDGGRIAAASGVILDLDPGLLAGDVAAVEDLARELGAGPLAWVLDSGEEHAMLATFAPGAVPPGFRQIGTVRACEAREEPAILYDGQRPDLQGFDHFA